MFERQLVAGWGDMDINSHMGNTAFLDKSADVRMMFFAEHGFPVEEFVRRRIGPVIQRDELEYFREIHLLEKFSVTLGLAGQADDGSRYLLRNEFRRADGELAARVTSAGGWLDLSARHLIVPPDPLLAAMQVMSRIGDFQALPSSIK
jgi:acyl-CoA thioester hydrolase